MLWNAGKVISDYLEQNAAELVYDKTILELGAGAGLPSMTCAMLDAKTVVVTDYHDSALVENLQFNVSACKKIKPDANLFAKGLVWGGDLTQIKSCITTDSTKSFDLLILADLLFNHSEHAKLVKTVQEALKKDKSAKALVFFTPYRPWLYEKDMAFFDLAKQNGFKVTKILEKLMDKVMFENDRGDETLRRTVFGFILEWAHVI